MGATRLRRAPPPMPLPRRADVAGRSNTINLRCQLVCGAQTQSTYVVNLCAGRQALIRVMATTLHRETAQRLACETVEAVAARLQQHLGRLPLTTATAQVRAVPLFPK